MAAKYLPITGSVLEWALTESGVDIDEAASSLKVQPQDIRAWISEEAQPNTGQFRRLLGLTSRPESFFFLPAPPTRSSPRAAYRRFADQEEEGPSPEVLAALRLAHRVQKVTIWLHDRVDMITPEVPSAETSESHEVVADRLRQWLRWSTTEQTAAKLSETDTAKTLRAGLQDRGVMVMHLTLDTGATRGFSLPHGLAPIIAVNTRDHVRARIFSYAHELVHLAIHDESVCLTRTNSGVERFCNRVAAALLMPEAVFRKYVKEKFGNKLISERSQVVTIRNYFKVSVQAAAIRAMTLGLATKTLYHDLSTEYEAKRQGGTYIPGNERTRPRIRVDQYGQGFVAAVLDAEESGVLRRPQVLDLLRVSDQEHHDLRRLTRADLTA